ncbi:MAG: hypothetical protein KGO81_13900 [Bacteroidota bacterium]|nr:hypothetical protein [Bacteroidota bacterium]
MNINRHNYEEFFLLYVDEELSAEQKATVDLFIRQNPDLAFELDALLQTKLIEDPIISFDKSILYKPENAATTVPAYEEQLLLFIDNELNNEEKNKVEKLIKENKEAEALLTLLKRTKLEKETVVYPYKQALYRDEHKRVIPLYWKQFSAAAIITGLAFLVWTFIPQHSPSDHQPVLAEKKVPAYHPKNNSIPAPEKESTIATNFSNHEQAIATAKNNTSVQHTNIIQQVKNTATNEPTPDKIRTGTTENKLTAPTDTYITSNNLNTSTTPGSIVKTDNDITKTTVAQAANHNSPKNTAMQVTSTVYKELNTDDADVDNHSVNVANIQINKDKLRGFFKRASHLFGKAKENEDQIAVASFAVNTN